MPLIHESYDSLPYVDAPPSADDIAKAHALIAVDIKQAGIDTSQPHPALIPAIKSYTPQYPPSIEKEHERLQADPASKLSAVDLKRYEELEAPENTNPTSDEDRPELLTQWNDALKKAHTSGQYVEGRLTELGLLEKFGKNAWLVGNSQLENTLKAIEADLAGVRKEQEETEVTRRGQQEAVGGELTTLEETWKTGVGRVLETEVAAEGLKQQILEKRRAGAV